MNAPKGGQARFRLQNYCRIPCREAVSQRSFSARFSAIKAARSIGASRGATQIMRPETVSLAVWTVPCCDDCSSCRAMNDQNRPALCQANEHPGRQSVIVQTVGRCSGCLTRNCAPRPAPDIRLAALIVGVHEAQFGMSSSTDHTFSGGHPIRISCSIASNF